MVLCTLAFYGTGERLPAVALSYVIQVALFMAIWTAWAWAPNRRRLLVWTTVVFVGMFGWVVVLVRPLLAEPTPPEADALVSPGTSAAVLTVVLNALYFFGAAWWGHSAWRSARQRAVLADQAEQLRAGQAERARRAVADERLRIARDLHDVVAHHVSGIGLQAAGAKRVWDRDPDAARRAVAVIEQSSRQAVGEMSQIVSLLRTDDAPEGRSDHDSDLRTPAPGLAALEDLVRQVRAGGLDVTLRRSGDPFPVSAPVEQALFRSVQEALANVRRHSTARQATVTLRWLGAGDDVPRAVEIEVVDDGAVRPGATAGTGLGLQGIRERAALYGGSTEVGPRPDVGFRVRVRIPQPAAEAHR
jgi:signal transduction histidine kinase